MSKRWVFSERCLHHRQYVFPNFNQPEITIKYLRKPRELEPSNLFRSFHPSRLNAPPSITRKKNLKDYSPIPGFFNFFHPTPLQPAELHPTGPDGIIRSIWVDQGRGCDPGLVVDPHGGTHENPTKRANLIELCNFSSSWLVY